ncbi:hypothetical protein HOE22_06160 [Candidatus Woesearchaeota archaeon]|nr:hypothetical protein [Candidatus Woesearchaeota archaeon]
MSFVTNEQKEWDLESKLIEEMWNNIDPITGDYIDPNGVVLDREAEELNELNKLKLVDQKGELLLECRIGDENHRLLLEVGLNTILEKILKEEK